MKKIILKDGTILETSEKGYQNFVDIVKKLPERWEDLKTIKGAYVDSTVKIVKDEVHTQEYNKDVFATTEQAEASIAMAQLSQLMAVYNDGWVPDFCDLIEQAKPLL